MFKLINSFMSSYHEYATYSARRQVHRVLIRQDERLLADAGFSKALLDQGLKAWPWQEAAFAEPPAASHPSPRIVEQAVRELRAYSDAELADLGLSRGSIVDSVRHGRSGMEHDEAHRAA